MQGSMTFVAAFYTFTIELNHSDRGIFSSFRIKVPRHELESFEHFYSRLIAFLHSYQPEIAFTNLIGDSKAPTIIARNEIGDTFLWIEIGTPDKRKLEISLKQNPHAEHRIYLYQPDDLSRFCHYLRGSKTNWVESVKFFQLDPEFTNRLLEYESSSPNWRISIIDDQIYLSIGDIDLECAVTPIDIWDAFQSSIIDTTITSADPS
jgi:uncharacterized protein YaeQ